MGTMNLQDFTLSPHILAPAALELLNRGLRPETNVTMHRANSILGGAVYLRRKDQNGGTVNPVSKNLDLRDVTEVAIVEDGPWRALVVQDQQRHFQIATHTGYPAP